MKLLLALCIHFIFYFDHALAKSLVCNKLLTSSNFPPLHKQKTNYTCGPASVLSWLKSKGDNKITEEDIARMMGTNKKYGTNFKQFTKGLAQLGLDSWFVDDLELSTIKVLLAKGYGVVINYQLENEGHWALLVEVAVDDSSITLMDPWYGEYIELSKKEFLPLWFDRFTFGNTEVYKKRGAIVIAPPIK